MLRKSKATAHCAPTQYPSARRRYSERHGVGDKARAGSTYRRRRQRRAVQRCRERLADSGRTQSLCLGTRLIPDKVCLCGTRQCVSLASESFGTALVTDRAGHDAGLQDGYSLFCDSLSDARRTNVFR
jgi:hypothetical protein